jgi:hypothetical protein
MHVYKPKKGARDPERRGFEGQKPPRISVPLRVKGPRKAKEEGVR